MHTELTSGEITEKDNNP